MIVEYRPEGSVTLQVYIPVHTYIHTLLHDVRDIECKYGFLECKYRTMLHGSTTD